MYSASVFSVSINRSNILCHFNYKSASNQILYYFFSGRSEVWVVDHFFCSIDIYCFCYVFWCLAWVMIMSFLPSRLFSAFHSSVWYCLMIRTLRGWFGRVGVIFVYAYIQLFYFFFCLFQF